MKKLSKFGECPKCNRNWDKGRIWKIWRELEIYDKFTDDELKEMEKKNYSKPYHFSKLVYVKNLYDKRFNHYQCPFCKNKFLRSEIK